MLIYCDVVEKLTKQEGARELVGVVVKCQRCGAEATNHARNPGKALYGAALRLGQDCPNREGNAYSPEREAIRSMVAWQQERNAARKGGA